MVVCGCHVNSPWTRSLANGVVSAGIEALALLDCSLGGLSRLVVISALSHSSIRLQSHPHLKFSPKRFGQAIPCDRWYACCVCAQQHVGDYCRTVFILNPPQDLSGNYISRRGCESLATMLQSASVLQTLDLSFTAIGDQGLALVVGALQSDEAHVQSKSRLQHLAVRRSQVTDAGMAHVASMLERNTHLRSLKLGNGDNRYVRSLATQMVVAQAHSSPPTVADSSFLG